MGPPLLQGHGTREANQDGRPGGCRVSTTASIDFSPPELGRGVAAGDPETSNQAAHGLKVHRMSVGAVATGPVDARCRQRRRARGCRRVLLAGASGGGSLASRVGLSLGLYDSPSMTKS